MQVLVFQLGAQQYAMETRHVVRVLPALALTRLPRAAAYIAGLMNYQGISIPVIDLARLCAETPSAAAAATMDAVDTPAAFDTRIVLIHHPHPPNEDKLLGLRIDHVLATRTLDPERIAASGVSDRQTPFLGRIVSDAYPMLQFVEARNLLPESVRAWLFQTPDVESPC